MKTFKEIDINYYDNSGNVQVRCTVPVTQDALVHYELMQSHYCKLSFKLSRPTYFLLGDFIETPYGRFELIDLTKAKDNDTIGYSYEIQFDAYYRKLKNKILKYRPNTGSQEATFSLTSKISTHIEVIMKNLAYYAKLDKSYLYDPNFEGEGTDYTYVIDASVDANAAKLITYSNSSILDAIANIAQTFGCEWWFEGNILHFGTCENTNAVTDFRLNDNIVSMSSSQSQSTYANRVYAFGAARNLPSEYKNDSDADITKDGVVEKRLMLPTSAECSEQNKQMLAENGFELKNGYIQVGGLREDQYVEGVTTNDDIYPRNLIKTSKVTSYEKDVEDESTPEEGDYIKRTFYRVNSLTIVNEDGEKTGDMAFRKAYILSGKNLHIVFQSGSLNGMDFECEFNPDGVPEILLDDDGNPIFKDGKEQINPKSQVFEIVANEDYGRFLPDTTLHPKDGDTFVLYNWNSTKLGDALVPSASNELLADAIKNLKKSVIDPTTYTCTAEDNYSYNHGRGNLHGVGARVNLYNKGYGDGYRSSRVIGYEFSLDIPFDGAKYYVGEKPSYSRLNAMESKIEELIYNGQSYLNGNGGSGRSIYIIKSYDSITPTDYNVFSAKAVDEQRLNKTKDDTAKGTITWEKVQKLLSGLLVGNFNNENGGSWNTDAAGRSHLITDYLEVRMKAIFEELVIKKTSTIGGKEILSPAGGVVAHKVEEVTVTYNNVSQKAYRCYFLAEQEGDSVDNDFAVNDQVRSESFNVRKGTYHKVGNHFYWRLVIGRDEDPVELEGKKYHYIDLSDTDCATSSDVPAKGDVLSQCGNRTDVDRQNCLIFSAVDTYSPFIGLYHGINSYSFANKEYVEYGVNKQTNKAFFNVYGDSYIGDKEGTSFFQYDSKKKEATFKGKMIFNSDSQLPDGSSVNDIAKKKDLNIKSGNLLRNTSFCGDYESIDISEDVEISEDKETFSEKQKYWTMENASIIDIKDSTSGKAVWIGHKLSQQLAQPLLSGKAYVLSFKGKGTTVKVSICGETHDVTMTSSFEQYELHITCSDAKDAVFDMVSTNCTVCEIMLSYGTIAPAWSPSYSDNDKSMAEFQNMKFLTDAISQGSTTIDGGLVMSQQFKVGNYRDKKMIKETGGMSGYYNDDDSPFLWGGGTLEQAIYTIQKYKDNPNYEPTAEELNNLAKFVVTHGGRAILTDIILRGIIYAEGGVMKSIKSPNGNFEIDNEGNAKLKKAVVESLSSVGGYFKDVSISGNIYTPYTIIDDNNKMQYGGFGLDWVELYYKLDLSLSGFNIQIGLPETTRNVFIQLPEDEEYLGAEVNIFCTYRYIGLKNVSYVNSYDFNSAISFETRYPIIYQGQIVKLKCVKIANAIRWIVERLSDTIYPLSTAPKLIAMYQVRYDAEFGIYRDYGITGANYDISGGFYDIEHVSTGVHDLSYKEGFDMIEPFAFEGMVGYSVDKENKKVRIFTYDRAGRTNDVPFGYRVYSGTGRIGDYIKTEN